jgi:hypothetical protein
MAISYARHLAHDVWSRAAMEANIHPPLSNVDAHIPMSFASTHRSISELTETPSLIADFPP